MNRNACFFLGFSMGAAVMYVFDPSGGRRRRALARDKFTHLTHATADTIDATARHWSNRAAGAVAEARGVFRSAHDERPDNTSAFDSSSGTTF